MPLERTQHEAGILKARQGFEWRAAHVGGKIDPQGTRRDHFGNTVSETPLTYSDCNGTLTKCLAGDRNSERTSFKKSFNLQKYMDVGILSFEVL